MNENKSKGVNKIGINWYPGHMAKTKRLIKENIDKVDIIYEVIDARIPLSSKIKDKDIESLINRKPRILIMTKSDLCDLSKTNLWVGYYEDMGYKVVLVDLINNKGVSKILDVTNLLLKDIDEKREAKGLNKRRYRALIIGIPNVGKSTLINRLVGKKAAVTGNKPGVTKSLSWIKINNNVDLLDSPGILWPKLENEEESYNLASFSAIKEEVLPKGKVACYILDTMYKKYKDNLKERYGIDEFDVDDVIPTYDIIGKKRGCLIRGGEVDYDKVSNLIINDLKEGRLGKVTFDEVK